MVALSNQSKLSTFWVWDLVIFNEQKMTHKTQLEVLGVHFVFDDFDSACLLTHGH